MAISGNQPTVTVRFDEYVETSSKKAALFKNVLDEKTTTTHWVPLGQIESIDNKGSQVKVIMTKWWAQKKGFAFDDSF